MCLLSNPQWLCVPNACSNSFWTDIDLHEQPGLVWTCVCPLPVVWRIFSIYFEPGFDYFPLMACGFCSGRWWMFSCCPSSIIFLSFCIPQLLQFQLIFLLCFWSVSTGLSSTTHPVLSASLWTSWPGTLDLDPLPAHTAKWVWTYERQALGPGNINNKVLKSLKRLSWKKCSLKRAGSV